MEKNRILTPEEELAEKLKRQRLQEQSDLELAKEAFGNTKKNLKQMFFGNPTVHNYRAQCKRKNDYH